MYKKKIASRWYVENGITGYRDKLLAESRVSLTFVRSLAMQNVGAFLIS